jgi:Acyl-coenzyme A:6-aminopenicillanic acid acyl-transferase
MKRRSFLLAIVLAPVLSLAEQRPAPAQAFTASAEALVDIYQPKHGADPKTFSTTIRVLRAPLKEAVGRDGTLAFQAPDRLRLSAFVDGSAHSVGRDGGEVWFHVSGKKWGVVGKPGVARFASNPASVDDTVLPAFEFAEKAKVALLPTLCTFEEKPAETVGGQSCRVIVATPTPATQEAFRIPALRIEFAIPRAGALPARIAVNDGRSLDVAVELVDARSDAPWPAEKWKVPAQDGDKIETTAVSHFVRFAESAIGGLAGAKIPTLPPPDGSRVLLGTEGKGRLELHDGVRVLFLTGTPEEMGRQQGTLVRKEVHNLVDRILYGVGVGSSLAKGRWFFGEIEEAQSRLVKFMDPRYLREMDALADAAGRTREEARLANYFPELFHCSGFAVLGSATKDGRIYHGRVLDYLKGVGLEQNACVMVIQPDEGNAWINVGYCGFVGSVTCMNEKGVSIGEMGGRGEGQWDGKPMAQLLRECMEKADTLDEAVAIMRRGPRTCEYYYVIADAKAKRAVGIKATPDIFEVVEAGGSHPQLPEPVKDSVLLSAGDRYTELVRRAKAGHGSFDAASARDLMTRPVCMNSNIHSALFCPDTLDVWVANADSENVASHTHYRKFNLGELMKAAPAPAKTTAVR